MKGLKILKPLTTDNHADVKMIGMVVGILVTLIVSVLVFFNIAASIDTSGVDEKVAENCYGLTPNTDAYNNSDEVTNASSATLSQSETFFAIAPIIAIVIVAVVILGYVSKI